VPPAKGALGDFDYDFSGIDFSGLLKGNDLRYDAMLASLSVQSPFASAILDSLAVKGDYQRQPGTVSLGGGEISVARLTASNPLLGGAPMFMAENASVSGNVSENDAGTHLDLKAAYRFGHFAVGDEFEISDAALGINFNHIDNEAVRSLYGLVTDAPAGLDESQMSALMLPILQDVLAGNPTLSLDPLEFSMPEGDFNGRVNLSIDSSALPAGQAPNLQNPAALMSALTTEIDLTAAKPVAERIGALFAQQNLPAIGPDGQPLPEEQRESAARAQASQMLQFLSGQGLIVDNGDTYSTSIRFANGAATANGQPIPFGF
jgi:uncharacterized protein YdgA (DUF945 family)